MRSCRVLVLFAVTVMRSIKTLGTPIKTITGLKGPWGVAVNNNGEIIIAESDEHCISIYSRTGEKLRSFGSYGSRQGEFNEPRGLAVDDDDNILVADSQNHCIQKFAADGTFITAVGKNRNIQLEFSYPTGIAIHPINKRIYVSESSKKRIQILNPDLTSHSIFSTKSKGQPRGIAFNRSAHNVC